MAAVQVPVNAAAKKKLDEQHLKLLREMVALPHNKHCFDCNQRGPTYVNMTIGSFVCTSCSGILRGINPPQRVKSISMASFTAEEIEMLQSRGNSFCQKVWLGLHDGRTPQAADARDEVKMRELMTQRYERKRWYVAPTPDMYREAKKQNTPDTTAAPTTRSSLTASSSQRSLPEIAATVPQSVQRPSSVVSPATDSTLSVAAAVGPPVAAAILNNTTGGKFDLLADFGGDPFSGHGTNVAQPPPPANNSYNFADFDTFSSHSSAPAGSFPTASFPTNFSTSLSASSATPTQSSGSAPVPADKYSALAELEGAFASPAAPAAAVNWDGTSTGVGWSGGAAPRSGSVFGSAGSMPAATGSSGFIVGVGPMPAQSTMLGGSSYGAGGGVTSAGFAAQANPFGISQPQMASGTAANPFMAGAGFGQVPVSAAFGQMPVSAGYGTMPVSAGYGTMPVSAGYNTMPVSAGYNTMPVSAGYGTMPVSAGFGQMQITTGYGPTSGAPSVGGGFGPVPVGMPAGYGGQFGGVPVSAAGYAPAGQMGMVNGGWSMGGTVTQVPQQQQQQQFAVWGQQQPAAASTAGVNPFLGGGVPTRSGTVSNPFL